MSYQISALAVNNTHIVIYRKRSKAGVFFVFEIGLAASNGVRFGPLSPGPLIDGVAKTFRSSTYT